MNAHISDPPATKEQSTKPCKLLLLPIMFKTLAKGPISMMYSYRCGAPCMLVWDRSSLHPGSKPSDVTWPKEQELQRTSSARNPVCAP